MKNVNTWCGVVCAVMCVGVTALADEPGEGWSGNDVEVLKGEVGRFQGGTMRYEVRTKFATLTSSHARVAITWRDKWAKEDVTQVLIEEERYARGEQYEFKVLPKVASVEVSYPCPQDRRDTVTMCQELWEWKKNTRRFVLESTSSSDPISEKMGELKGLIKKGKFDQAKKIIEALEDEHGVESLDREVLFEAFWSVAIDQAVADGKKSSERGVKTLEKFLANPMVTSAQRCPDKELITVCLEPEQVECGCSNEFGQVPGFEGRWPKRYTALAKLLGKAEAYELVEKLLVPALEQVPEDTELMLVVADMYWHKKQEYKARPLYKKVRKIRMRDKVYIPNRVFERFDK